MVFVLTSCSSTWTNLRRGRELTGAREVSVVNGNAEEHEKLEAALAARGIRTVFPRNDRILTRYSLEMSGACAFNGLRVEIFDREANDIAFIAQRPSGLFDCPGSTFDDVAAELDRLWSVQKVPELEDPSLRRKVD